MKNISLSILSAVLLGACASNGGFRDNVNKGQSNFATVNDILDSVKCGVGIYLRDRDEGNAKFDVNTGTANLYLTDVSVHGKSKEGGLEIPVLGIALGPKYSKSKNLTATDITQFTFEITMDDTTDETALAQICSKNENKTTKHKLSDILLGYGNAINKVTSGKPVFQAKQFIIDTRFQIVNSSDSELGIDFSVVELGSQKTKSKTKTQRLLITFGVSGEIFFSPAG